MALLKVKGLVLRANAANDRDRYVGFLSAETGWTEAYVRGALRAKSQLLAPTEAFSFSELTLFCQKEKYYVNEATFLYPFTGLKASLEAMTAAAHLTDVLGDLFSAENEKYEVGLAYELMLRALYGLEQAATGELTGLLALTHAAEIRLLADAGYRLDFSLVLPDVEAGVSGTVEEKLYFSFPEMRFFTGAEGKNRYNSWLHDARSQRWLNRHSPEESYLGQAVWPVSRALFKALRYCSECPLESLFAFRMRSGLADEFSAFCNAYRTATLEKTYRRLDYLRELAKLGEAARIRRDDES